MTGKNLLFIMSDEHSRRILGCYGNDVIYTPTLDRMAANGTLFENAFCNSPICVPSRASFATGRYVHDIGCWDNGIPYRGDPEGWGHRLLALGHEVDSIGKLHSRAMPGRVDRWLFGAVILSSAFLIFLVQPMVGKRVLPWYGGVPAVWTVCLTFYQLTLFAGYAYAHALIRFCPSARQLGSSRIGKPQEPRNRRGNGKWASPTRAIRESDIFLETFYPSPTGPQRSTITSMFTSPVTPASSIIPKT